MSFIEQIHACNGYSLSSLCPFAINDERYGYISADFAAKLVQFPSVFSVTDNTVSLCTDLISPADRTAAVAEITHKLHQQGHIRGWYDELFSVTHDFHQTAAMEIERAAAIYFGIRAFGVHVNGLVDTSVGTKIWVATRAKDKNTFPGMLDHIVAGGQPAGLGLLENVIKEADEEASIPHTLASKASLVSEITYCLKTDQGLKADTLFCFDLHLPESFTPKSNDGEVESFQLISLMEVADIVENTTRFKPNCNLVIIDLLIRKGIIRNNIEKLRDTLSQPLP